MDVYSICTINRILSTTVLKNLFIFFLVLALNVFVLFGFFHSCFVIVCYLVGIYSFYILLNYVGGVAEILSLLVNVLIKKYWFNEQTPNQSEMQDKDMLLIPENLNDALQQFMSKLLDHYVTHWYGNISSDTNFPHEIRVVLRRAVSVCYRRLSRVQLDNFIFKRALPVTLNHMSDYEKMKHDTGISYLHVAVHSRSAEVMYLQNVSKSLLRYILPEAELQCKPIFFLAREILTHSLFLALSDAVCNPEVLNPLFLRYLNGGFNFSSDPNTNRVEKVELLEKFISELRAKPNDSSLRPELAVILKDLELREVFMTYLKIQNVDHVLQFCIDVELFNQKLLKPNLEIEDLDDLYRDAWDIYSVYFSSHSPNCINFNRDLASVLRKALSKDVLKLRSTIVLFEAYDYVFSQLEGFCFDFYTSIQFYLWLYGRCESLDLCNVETLPQAVNSTAESASSLKSVFELGNKLKDVLKPNSVLEGQIQNKDNFDMSMELGEDVQINVASCERNINNWKISIPTVGSRLDPITNKAYTVFVIQVETEEGNEWIVERRTVDFNSLDSKLTQFHGACSDYQLPSKKQTRAECIQSFEEYLNKLIKNPSLKSSQLLSTFLTSTDEFEEEESTLGKLLRKSVVPTLRKERGQNLETFISSFVSSCRTTKYEWKDVTEKQLPKKTSVASILYGNNFDISPEMSEQIFLNQITMPTNNDSMLTRPSTSAIYLGINVFNLHENITKILLSLQSFIGGVFDQILLHIIRGFCGNVITPSNIAYFVNVIEKSIFESKERVDPDQVKLEIVNSLNMLKGNWLHRLYVTSFQMTQDAKLNKQLYYQLMDVLLEELFPELRSTNQN